MANYVTVWQWRIQGLEVGWAQRVCWRKSPAESRGRAPRWGSQMCIYNLQWTNPFSKQYRAL